MFMSLVEGPFFLYLAIYGGVIGGIIFGVIYFRGKNKQAERKGWEEGKRGAEQEKLRALRRLKKQHHRFETEDDGLSREIIDKRGIRIHENSIEEDE